MTSRRQLYEAGLPFGESCTRMEGGRRIYGGGGGGGGGSSSSSSTTSTTTQNTDKRIAISEGIGISSDSSTVNVSTLDAGIVNKALDTVSAADATAGDGFGKLLALADKLFVGAGEVIDKTQTTTMAQIGALSSAQNDAKGAIDQKTIVVLAIAGAAALVLSKRG